MLWPKTISPGYEPSGRELESLRAPDLEQGLTNFGKPFLVSLPSAYGRTEPLAHVWGERLLVIGADVQNE